MLGFLWWCVSGFVTCVQADTIGCVALVGYRQSWITSCHFLYRNLSSASYYCISYQLLLVYSCGISYYQLYAAYCTKFTRCSYLSNLIQRFHFQVGYPNKSASLEAGVSTHSIGESDLDATFLDSLQFQERQALVCTCIFQAIFSTTPKRVGSTANQPCLSNFVITARTTSLLYYLGHFINDTVMSLTAIDQYLSSITSHIQHAFGGVVMPWISRWDCTTWFVWTQVGDSLLLPLYSEVPYLVFHAWQRCKE